MIVQLPFHVNVLADTKHARGGLEKRRSSAISVIELKHVIVDIRLTQHTVDALVDPAMEIQTLAHMLLVRLSKIVAVEKTSRNNPLIGYVDSEKLALLIQKLAEAMRASILAKTNSSAVKQEVEKQQEIAGSALKALLEFSRALGLVAEDETGEGNVKLLSIPGNNASLYQPRVTLWQDVIIASGQPKTGKN